ncbi:pentapeptide repeat-containing protein [Caballeronia terrestris]|uniref:Pentapeptide repeat-containing protein n=1 Tax=Caballeronia terrestris TaxID=1226301 RepID=A0A158GAA4_9BURK|nr:DUF2169 domain-containing protein [Caballeronia terrestris]SAL29064.1 pentapeptide repeat-containing protein [Caballeronia terrestris]
MWQIKNRTPFAAAQSWIRDMQGAETWLVVVKATFDIRDDGSTHIAPQQPGAMRTPSYRGAPGRSSIVCDNDFVLTKRNTDVVVNGTAWAAGGRPTQRLDVAMRIGSARKVLRVTGDRVWLGDGVTVSDPKPFMTMPLVYERAFGGIDSASPHPERDWYWPNPTGTGFAVSRNHLRQKPLPNIEYPGELITQWDARPRPAGFGVIAPNWSGRARFAGTYDDKWIVQRQPLLPDDFDERYYQSVPEDQQSAGFLRGGEPVTLVNLSRVGRLNFMLPTMDLVFETRFKDGTYQEHERIDLHTVLLEPDYPRVSLIWQSAMECHAKVYKLDRTVIDLRLTRPTRRQEELDDLLSVG